LHGLQGKISGKTTTAGTVTYAYTRVMKQSAKGALNMIHTEINDDPKRNGEGHVFGVNPAYAFSLRRKDTERPWLLGELEMSKGAATSPLAATTSEAVEANLSVLISIRRTALVELLRQPTFRVLAAKLVQHQGSEAVSIEFDNAHAIDRKARPFVPVQSGTLVLDPSHGWCLRDCSVVEKYYGTESLTHVETSYRDFKGKFAIPVTVVEKVQSRSDRPSNPETFLQVTSFDLEVAERPLPDEEFTLSAFGLPEPVGVVWPKPTRWWLWISASAIGAALLTVLFWKLRDKFRKNQLPNADGSR
jgi:hypothetical protein